MWRRIRLASQKEEDVLEPTSGTDDASPSGWLFHALSSGGASSLASGTAGWLILATCRSRPTVWHGGVVEPFRRVV